MLNLPRLEKLRLMEVLWMELIQPESDYDSPPWHETVLRETEHRLADGKEKSLDWEKAKKLIRES